MKATTKMPRALTVESLEDRLALSVTSASYSGGMIFLNGNDSASNVSIRQSGLKIQVTDSTNNFSYSRSFSSQTALDAARVQFVGGASADRVVNYCRNVALQAWGYGGNDYLEGYNDADTLVGGSDADTLVGYGGDDRMWGEGGNDVLKGMDGNDRLYGGADSDDLYGGAGYDYLYGEDGDDFLDSGSNGEYLNGGAGYDFNAYVTAINGTQRDDVRQGGGPTCWLLSSLSAVAARVNMADRIVYQGNGSYRVKLFTSTGATHYQYVNFAGERNGADPNFNPSQEGESWVVIMQRAVLQEMGLSTTSPPGGNPANALPMLTGRASTWYGTPSSSTGLLGNTDAERIMSALASGRYVAMCTYGEGTTLATTKLVNWHCYNVVSVTRSVVWQGLFPTFQYSVTVRNPWGYDGASGSGNTSDGLITLSWAQFAGSISGYAVN